MLEARAIVVRGKEEHAVEYSPPYCTYYVPVSVSDLMKEYFTFSIDYEKRPRTFTSPSYATLAEFEYDGKLIHADFSIKNEITYGYIAKDGHVCVLHRAAGHLKGKTAACVVELPDKTHLDMNDVIPEWSYPEKNGTAVTVDNSGIYVSPGVRGCLTVVILFEDGPCLF